MLYQYTLQPDYGQVVFSWLYGQVKEKIPDHGRQGQNLPEEEDEPLDQGWADTFPAHPFDGIVKKPTIFIENSVRHKKLLDKSSFLW
jgi:hypothetical protein